MASDCTHIDVYFGDSTRWPSKIGTPKKEYVFEKL